MFFIVGSFLAFCCFLFPSSCSRMFVLCVGGWVWVGGCFRVSHAKRRCAVSGLFLLPPVMYWQFVFTRPISVEVLAQAAFCRGLCLFFNKGRRRCACCPWDYCTNFIVLFARDLHADLVSCGQYNAASATTGGVFQVLKNWCSKVTTVREEGLCRTWRARPMLSRRQAMFFVHIIRFVYLGCFYRQVLSVIQIVTL